LLRKIQNAKGWDNLLRGELVDSEKIRMEGDAKKKGKEGSEGQRPGRWTKRAGRVFFRDTRSVRLTARGTGRAKGGKRGGVGGGGTRGACNRSPPGCNEGFISRLIPEGEKNHGFETMLHTRRLRRDLMKHPR